MLYLSADEILRINEQVSGLGLRDRHLLESAADRPRSSAFQVDAYPDIHAKAAALFQSLCKNHAFIDGNKRTAVLAIAAFYGLNGYELRLAEDIDLVHIAVDVTVDQITEVDEIAQMFKSWVVPLPDP